MSPFNKNAKCVKCGGRKINASYCKKEHGYISSYRACYGHDGNEHILRHCLTCHYEWLEACLDAKVKA